MRQSVLSALALALPALALASLAACGDDNVKPGDLAVNWSHGPTATCESRHVTTVTARAYLKGELQKSESTSCPSTSREGAIALTELPPGSYTVEVEASDAAGKGLYLGSATKQQVKEGGATSTSTITLVEKPVRLNVTWSTPSGMCAASPIREVLVQYIPNASTQGVVTEEEQVACDNEIKDPDDSTNLLAGVLFVDLTPNSDVKIFAFGLDSAGKKIAKGESTTLILQAGDEPTVNIPLTTCPGSPPSCN